MATNPPPPETAVTAYEPKTIQIGTYDPNKYNLLIRGQSVVQSNPFLRPIVRQITLDQPGDTYPITQRKDGNDWVATEVGISAVGLANLADQAGIIDVPQASGRADDGRDPAHVTWRATGAMRMPDGQWIVRTRDCTVKLATLEKEIRTQKTAKFEQAKKSQYPWTEAKLEAEIAKELLLKEKFMERLAETGAVNRVTKALLGLRQKYTPAEIARPFVLMAVVPDMEDPDIRQHAKEQAMLSIGAVFGPGAGAAAPKMLSAGPSAEDLPAPDEIEGGELDPSELAGVAPVVEKAAAADEPGADDAGDDPLPAWATDQPAAADEPTLLTKIRDSAAAGGMVGPAKKPQLEAIGGKRDKDGNVLTPGIFTPIGGRATTAGLKALWPDLDTEQLTANQVQAIIGVSRTYETPEAFQAAWREMAGLE